MLQNGTLNGPNCAHFVSLLLILLRILLWLAGWMGGLPENSSLMKHNIMFPQVSINCHSTPGWMDGWLAGRMYHYIYSATEAKQMGRLCSVPQARQICQYLTLFLTLFAQFSIECCSFPKAIIKISNYYRFMVFERMDWLLLPPLVP